MLETISEIFREAYIKGWITARDGNASIRYREQKFFMITPSGVRKQTLQPEMFKKIGLRDSGWIEENYTDISARLNPSGELPMHFGLQKNINTDVRVVLHLHPTYTVAALYKGINLPSLVEKFPELKRYSRIGSSVPSIPPITQELADACIENFDLGNNGINRYDIIGMTNHGVVAVDTSPWRAFEHIERLEHICKIVLAASKES